MSESAFAEWCAAFVKAQAEMPEITKNKTATIEMKNGGKFSYSYADLPDIIAAIRPKLADHGLAIGQSTERIDGAMGVFTRIYHQAGHVETFGPVVLPSGGDARAAGSAITYARRYALCAALNIAADEDDDGKAAVSSRPAQEEKPQLNATVQGWVDSGATEKAVLEVAIETARDLGNPEPSSLFDLTPAKYDAAYLQTLKANVQARLFSQEPINA